MKDKDTTVPTRARRRGKWKETPRFGFCSGQRPLMAPGLGMTRNTRAFRFDERGLAQSTSAPATKNLRFGDSRAYRPLHAILSAAPLGLSSSLFRKGRFFRKSVTFWTFDHTSRPGPSKVPGADFSGPCFRRQPDGSESESRGRVFSDFPMTTRVPRQIYF